MDRPLAGLTNEALWQLFPILLSDHDPAWAARYEEEAEGIARMIGEKHIKRMRHIGSTAVPGLVAKPTVDILLEIVQGTDILRIFGRTPGSRCRVWCAQARVAA